MEIKDLPSRPINLWRKPKDKYAPAVYDRLDTVQKEVEEQEKRRARDSRSADKFRKCLRAICLDLFDAYLDDVELQVGVPRDNTALSSNNPAIPDFVSARPFRDALDGLIATGNVEQLSIGNESSRLRTRVRGTKKLIERIGVGELRPELL